MVVQSCDLAPLKFSAAGGGKRRCAFACTTIHRSFSLSLPRAAAAARFEEPNSLDFLEKFSSLKMAGKGIGCLSEALGALRISAPKVCVSALSFL